MRFHVSALVAAAAIALSACGTVSDKLAGKGASAEPAAASSASPYGPARLVKSRDGRFDGEVFGQASVGGKFAKVQIGMEFSEVTNLIGAPANMSRHETGKRWIPFYYGNDVQRMQTLYKGDGCLVFTGGNHWGGGGNELIAIYHDAAGKCFE